MDKEKIKEMFDKIFRSLGKGIGYAGEVMKEGFEDFKNSDRNEVVSLEEYPVRFDSKRTVHALFRDLDKLYEYWWCEQLIDYPNVLQYIFKIHYPQGDSHHLRLKNRGLIIAEKALSDWFAQNNFFIPTHVFAKLTAFQIKGDEASVYYVKNKAGFSEIRAMRQQFRNH